MITTIVVVLACNAQERPYQSDNPIKPRRYEIRNPDFVGRNPSFDQLFYWSDLIIDGTVDEVLPSVTRGTPSSSSIIGSMQTQSLVSVKGVFRGELPAGTRTVALVQAGGTSEGYEVVVPDDPLVKPGERYILFLMKDRQEPANDLGVPRFWAAGYWSGMVKVTDEGTIQFLPAARAALHSFDGSNVAAFVAVVKQRIKELFEPPPPLPPGFIPGPPPPGVPLPPGAPKL